MIPDVDFRCKSNLWWGVGQNFGARPAKKKKACEAPRCLEKEQLTGSFGRFLLGELSTVQASRIRQSLSHQMCLQIDNYFGKIIEYILISMALPF